MWSPPSSQALLPKPCGGDVADATAPRPPHRNRWQTPRWQTQRWQAPRRQVPRWQALGRLVAVVGLAWIDTLLIGSVVSMIWLGVSTAGLILLMVWPVFKLTMALVATVSGIGFGLVFLANLWPVACGRLPAHANLALSGWVVLAGIILAAYGLEDRMTFFISFLIAPAAIATGCIAVLRLKIRAKRWIR